MAINVEWNADPTIGAIISNMVGGGMAAQRQQDIARQEAQQNERLAEQARQFNLSAAMRMDAQNDANRRWYASAAMQNANAAAARQANLINAQNARQAQLMELGMRGQQAADARDYQWDVQTSQTNEEAVNGELARIRNLKLDPEGERIRNELSGKVRAIQAAPLRPEQRAAMMGRALNEINEAGFDNRVPRQPSAEDNVRESMVGLGGQQNQAGQPMAPGWYQQVTQSRSGAPQIKKVYIPPVNAEQAQAERDRYAVNGGWLFPSENGDYKFVSNGKSDDKSAGVMTKKISDAGVAMDDYLSRMEDYKAQLKQHMAGLQQHSLNENARDAQALYAAQERRENLIRKRMAAEGVDTPEELDPSLIPPPAESNYIMRPYSVEPPRRPDAPRPVPVNNPYEASQLPAGIRFVTPQGEVMDDWKAWDEQQKRQPFTQQPDTGGVEIGPEDKIVTNGLGERAIVGPDGKIKRIIP